MSYESESLQREIIVLSRRLQEVKERLGKVDKIDDDNQATKSQVKKVIDDIKTVNDILLDLATSLNDLSVEVATIKQNVRDIKQDVRDIKPDITVIKTNTSRIP